LTEKEVMLARYEGKKLFEVEKAKTDNNGILILEDEVDLPCGLYVFILPENVSFELLIPAQDQEFQLFANYPSVLTTLEARGNHVVSQFVAYQKSFISLSRQQSDVQKRLLSNFQHEDSVFVLKENYAQLRHKKQNIENRFVNDNKDNILGSYIYWSQHLQEHLFKDGSIENLINQFSEMNIPEACLVNSPLFEVFMNDFGRSAERLYFKDQQRIIDRLIDRIAVKDIRYQKILTFLYNFYNNPNDAEKESVFHYLVRNYYLSDNVDWVAESLKAELKQLIYTKNNTILGASIPDLPRSVEKELPEFGQSNAPLTWLFIIENDCKSCHDLLQKTEQLIGAFQQSSIYIIDLGDKITSNRLSAYPDAWHISNHVNLSDKITEILKLSRVPGIYVMDKNNEIVAKGHSFAAIEKILKKRPLRHGQ
jgi:hypothetical protein